MGQDALFDFDTLAKRISGWTTNFLATAIVLVGGLVLGWQVLAWWHEEPRTTGAASALALSDLPRIEESREFWTKHGSLQVERVRGGAEDAQRAMRAFCRRVETNHERPAGDPGEESFVVQLRGQSPLEETSDLALYQPPGQTAMLVAVSRSRQRIVGWSFAIPSADDVWSVYHFKPAVTFNAVATKNVP